MSDNRERAQQWLASATATHGGIALLWVTYAEEIEVTPGAIDDLAATLDEAEARGRAEERDEARAGALEYLVAISMATNPGSTKHPAFDSSWLLDDLAQMRENYDAAQARAERLREALRFCVTALDVATTHLPADRRVVVHASRMARAALAQDGGAE